MQEEFPGQRIALQREAEERSEARRVRREERAEQIAIRQREKEAREARKAALNSVGARQERRIATRARNKRQIMRDNLRQIERELRATRLFNLALKRQIQPQPVLTEADMEARRITSATWRKNQRTKPVTPASLPVAAAERSPSTSSKQERKQAEMEQWRRDNPALAAAMDVQNAAMEAAIEILDRAEGLK